MNGSKRWRLGWAASCVLLVSVACSSPTLPLPPPTPPTITFGSEPDTVRLASLQGVLPNALVIVVNQNPTLGRDLRVAGTIADEQGSWELVVHASVGDRLDVSQEADGVRSAPSTVEVR